MNILGTVHNLKIPKQEILTMQQWNEHKKSATHQSLPEFICNYLKFNVVAMNIKLKPAAQDTVSANMASPIGPSTMPQATNVQLDVFVLEQPTEEIHAKAEQQNSSVNLMNIDQRQKCTQNQFKILIKNKL